jgi:hypothetical protein
MCDLDTQFDVRTNSFLRLTVNTKRNMNHLRTILQVHSCWHRA